VKRGPQVASRALAGLCCRGGIQRCTAELFFPANTGWPSGWAFSKPAGF